MQAFCFYGSASSLHCVQVLVQLFLNTPVNPFSVRSCSHQANIFQPGY